MKTAFQSKNDHPGYSCERAPWALVTVVGPFLINLWSSITSGWNRVKTSWGTMFRGLSC